jgi:hypothetical protein
MANKNLFKPLIGKLIPATDALRKQMASRAKSKGT